MVSSGYNYKCQTQIDHRYSPRFDASGKLKFVLRNCDLVQTNGAAVLTRKIFSLLTVATLVPSVTASHPWASGRT